LSDYAGKTIVAIVGCWDNHMPTVTGATVLCRGSASRWSDGHGTEALLLITDISSTANIKTTSGYSGMKYLTIMTLY